MFNMKPPTFNTPENVDLLMKSFDKIGEESARKFREDSERIRKEYRRKAIITNTIIGAVTVAAIVAIIKAPLPNE
jgi:hypothetical protein